MAIAANIIFIWTGTNASIPAGWTRETGLDTLYPKGTAAATDPGGTGGALTHSHATTSHQHTGNHVHTVPNSGNGSGSSNRDAATTNPPAVHAHNTNPNTVDPTSNTLTGDTPASSSDNHEPAFYKVIFIKSNGTPLGVPSNGVALWSNAGGAPTNWNLCDGAAGRPDLRSVFLKGADAGGDSGGTGGAATHTHSIVTHTHTTPFAHAHPNVTSSATGSAAVSGSISGANVSVATQAHTHVLTIASGTSAITGNTDAAAASNGEPPYLAEAFIQNNTGGESLPENVIGLWLGTLASIPVSWTLCDGGSGTPDLRAQYVKGAATLGGIGGTGGSLTHGASHTTTGHLHAMAGHTHTVTAATGGAGNRTAGATATPTAAHTHPSWSPTGNNGAYNSSSTAPAVSNYTDTQPPFKTVAFIRYAAQSQTARSKHQFRQRAV
jgi:hypothetical protein